MIIKPVDYVSVYEWYEHLNKDIFWYRFNCGINPENRTKVVKPSRRSKSVRNDNEVIPFTLSQFSILYSIAPLMFDGAINWPVLKFLSKYRDRVTFVCMDYELTQINLTGLTDAELLDVGGFFNENDKEIWRFKMLSINQPMDQDVFSLKTGYKYTDKRAHRIPIILFYPPTKLKM